ncbi:MAG: HAD-IA family hydrolase [Bacteroidaceae bacterium]|nr:HAD-IA family hydrolase [Bacteroidaceae bacterium]
MIHPTTLIFDLDGTLTDSGLGILRCAQYALDHFSIHVDDLNQLRPFVGPPLEDSFIQFYGFTPEQANEAVRVYRERYFTTGVYENEVYPGTHEALSELQHRGFRMGIGSSKNEPMVHKVLHHFDLARYFDFIAARDEAGIRHTKADVLRHALSTEKIDDTRTALMIGDRFYDIEGAHEVGIPAVGILWGGYATRQEMIDCHADFIADTWDDLLCYLQNTA